MFSEIKPALVSKTIKSSFMKNCVNTIKFSQGVPLLPNAQCRDEVTIVNCYVC